MYGLLSFLPWWGYVVVLLAMTQLTIFAVTIYLHRCQAHRALDLHPIVSHVFRFWLWMSTGMVTKEWAAIHRKHHAKVETDEDPHSPVAKGIKKVFFEGAELYRAEAKVQETMARYGQGTPDDWMERHVYSKHSAKGIALMFIIDALLFGLPGISMWAIQMAWIPFWAAGVVNGIGHYFGYRNFESKDASRNIFPIGFFIGGEELHNNHHAYATSAKFSAKWFEFDMGWLVIRGLEMLGLAKPKRVLPTPKTQADKRVVDMDTIKALISYRFQVLARYSREVMVPMLREEQKNASKATRHLLRRAKTVLVRDDFIMEPKQKSRLANVLENFQSLNLMYQFRERLAAIWSRSTASQTELMEALQEWCQQAEATGNEALRRFSAHLKTYVPQEVA
ncbi:MAG TPA: fatty acid desaturase [Gammaproteobacteria bacterium]|jgi:stearoyl-CoA desaturase (delta-9 desaturase)|nr:fatty acid desaturase [Gammaproteobacteria bacterium]